jgi:hypothetical protein
MKSLIRKILKEEHKPTETEPLYWKLSKKMVDELGIKLFNENDVVYMTEIHFDTQNVLFELFSRYPSGEEIHYADDFNVPGDFRANILIPIKKLPRNVLTFIGRRLDPRYVKYIEL